MLSIDASNMLQRNMICCTAQKTISAMHGMQHPTTL